MAPSGTQENASRGDGERTGREGLGQSQEGEAPWKPREGLCPEGRRPARFHAAECSARTRPDKWGPPVTPPAEPARGSAWKGSQEEQEGRNGQF